MRLFSAFPLCVAVCATVACHKKDPHRFEYQCRNGRKITAQFGADGKDQVALRLNDGTAMTLPHVPSASGVKYAARDDKIIFWARGDEAIFEEDGEGPVTECTSR